MATRGSQISPRTVWTVALHVLLILGTLFILRQTWTVVSWILIALFVALALDPAIRWLQGRGIRRRGIALLVVYLAGFGLVTAMSITFAPMIADQARRLVDSAPEMARNVQSTTAFRWLDGRVNVDEAVREAASKISVMPVIAAAGKVATGLAAFITITSLSIFMLLFGGEVFEKILAWVEPSKRERCRLLARRMHRRVGGYVSGTLLVACIGGGVIATTLAVLGNPYFLPLGLVMIVLGVIPWVGSALGALLVVGTTFASQGGKAALIVLGIYLVYQQVENHLSQPLVQRHTIRMNPLLIALVMLIGTALFGLLGALLALPVAGAVQVYLQDLHARKKAQWREQERRDEDPRQLPLWGGRPDEPPHSLH